MRKPCDLWAEPAQRLQAKKLICSRHGASVWADDKDVWRMGGARTHIEAEELIFSRHGPPVLADDQRCGRSSVQLCRLIPAWHEVSLPRSDVSSQSLLHPHL